MDRNGGKASNAKYQIKPLTKTEFLRGVVQDIVAGVGDQEFTEAHVIRFVKDELKTNHPFDTVSSSLLYRIVSREIDRLYTDGVLERFVGGPPWVYINAEVYHEKG